ncbi:hypothetical protein BDB01DRAFT_728059 [Pilobolus umbonatus]|nr:hypothetical protein BDB01DRAFT_728059 [Pilobolus umbonatus]
MEFKDVLLPGQTMISTFNLEEDSILFTRDPDIYRYRIAALPDITSAPHSTESQLISLNTSVPGDPIRAYHQPIGTEAHENILCKLYSPNETTYDITDIKGIEVNKNGTLLAIWTESNSVYVYKRGSGDRVHNDNNVPGSGSPHHLDRQLDWILRMVITPKEGQYNPVIPVGASMFWEMSGSNYISIALKNNAVYTYYIDQAREQKAVNFHSFIRDRWDLWFAMSTIVTLFTLNEYKSYSL